MESRVLLSVDPVSEAVAGAVSNPDVDADLSTQISTYSEETTDLAEGYALDVEEAYLDATQAELESEMDEFFAEAAEAVQEYDPYAGLSETPVADYLADYDDELANLESSASSESPVEGVSADNSGSVSTSADDNGEANASDQNASSQDASGQGETDEEGSIFDYDNEISSYAEQVITETLNPTPASGEGEDASSEESTDSSEESPSSGTTGSTTTGSTTTGGTTTGSTTTGSTATLADGASEEFVNPFVVPAGLEVSGVELPTEVTGEVDLLTVTPTSPGSFTSVVTGYVPASVDPVNDPELGSGTKTSLAAASLVTTQTWTSPTDWTIKHTLGNTFSSSTDTTDSDGVSHGKLHTGRSTTTITISSTGTSTYSYTASDSVTTSQFDGWDDSNSTLGTIDKGGYLAAYTVSSGIKFTMTDTLVTLPDGSPGRTSDVYFSLNSFNSANFGASYQLYESTGALAAYGRDPITQSVFRSAGGNGETLDASGGFNVYGSTDVTIWMDASATYPDGGEIQDSDITGSAGFDTEIISGGGVGQGINYESQSHSGTPGTDSETYEYIKLGFSDSSSSNVETTVNASFSLDDPIPGTTTTGDGIDDFEVDQDDDNSTEFSLLIDTRSPTEYDPINDGKYYTILSVNTEMNITGSFDLDVTKGFLGAPRIDITTSGNVEGHSMTSFATYEQFNPMNWSPDGIDITYDSTLWIVTQSEGWKIESDWSFTVGIGLFGLPTFGGSWTGKLTWEADDLVENYTKTVYHNAYTGAHMGTEETYAYEQGMWEETITGSLSSSGGSINSSGVKEEWTTYQEGNVLDPLVIPPDPSTQALDDIQSTLDWAGMAPIVGNAADLVNVAIHAGRGNWGQAAIGLGQAIPIAGQAIAGAKIAKKAASKVDDVGELLIKKSDDLGEQAVKLCFPADTLVQTESGNKAIQSVEVGERVWAYDVVTSDWRLCQVRQTFERDYEGDSVFVTVADETIESTFRHPYWVIKGDALADRPLLDHHVAIPENATTPGRWVDAGDLQIGDVLLLRDGRQVPIQSIELKPVTQKVYNFEVEDLHNYAVGKSGVLAHNNNGDEAIPSLVDVTSLQGRQLKREFTGNKIKKLKKSMKKAGYDEDHPIVIAVVDGHNIIIDGHHRARAAGAVGIKQVPVQIKNVTAAKGAKLLSQAAEAAQDLGLPF